MDAEILHEFIKQTEEYLPMIRGGILICAQSGGVYDEISASLKQTASIRSAASMLGLEQIAGVCAEFERQLKSVDGGAAATAGGEALGDEDARRLLDKLAELELLVAEIYFGANDFSENVSSLVERSFGQFESNRNGENRRKKRAQEFEIDQEMLDIFALEADELACSFSRSLNRLKNFPADREALAEMSRSAHTLKGSAGVVGLKIMSDFAHGVEDLLDYLTDAEIAGNDKIFELLFAASDCFEALAKGDASEHLTKKVGLIVAHSAAITASFKTTEREISSAADFQIFDKKTDERTTLDKERSERLETPKAAVRVSLEKLDELVKIADCLTENRTTFERIFAECGLRESDDLASLFDGQTRLIEEMRNKLLGFRMVRFGSLAARFKRTVRVACDEEDKSAELFIEGENLEIDTQILERLIEPLLHLLRNAVAHGIEAPDLRRLLGKRETGKIFLRATCEKGFVVITISDDGRGISADALREKAIECGFLSRLIADEISDDEAFELMFLHGLTTNDKIGQTAGRGVGMNIVKTSVERQRGTISIASEARRGTTFTVRLPSVLQPANSLSVLIVDDSPSVRHATSGLMKNAGWKPQTAGNGLEALEILRAAKPLPDVILTDLEMPLMDGYELLELLKAQENLCKIPVLMITSRTSDEHRRKAVDLGACEYLTKPFDEKFLVDKIKNLTRFA